MYHLGRHFLRILVASFLVQEITPSSVVQPPREHNITEILNKTIWALFRPQDPETIFNFLKSNEEFLYEVENTNNLKPFGDKIFFNILSISEEIEASVYPVCRFKKRVTDFITCTTYINYENVKFRIRGDIYIDPNKVKRRVGFQSELTYANLTLTQKGRNSTIDISYGNAWPGLNELIDYDHLAHQDQLKLLYLIGTTSLEIAQERLRFTHHRDDIFKLFQRNFPTRFEQTMNRFYPDFQNDTRRYYYFIPEIRIAYTHLRNIKITGLSNFQSCIFLHKDLRKTGKLTVNNVQVSLQLDAGYKHLPLIEVRLAIDQLFVEVQFESYYSNEIKVKLHNYTFVEMNSQLERFVSSRGFRFPDLMIRWFSEGLVHSIAPSWTSSRRKVHYWDNDEDAQTLKEVEQYFIEILKNVTTNQNGAVKISSR